MVIVFGKLLMLAVKATWGITKVLVSLVFLPLLLIGLVLGGLLYIAFPILIVIGLISFISAV